jgi:hypothetical protein
MHIAQNTIQHVPIAVILFRIKQNGANVRDFLRYTYISQLVPPISAFFMAFLIFIHSFHIEMHC